MKLNLTLATMLFVMMTSLHPAAPTVLLLRSGLQSFEALTSFVVEPGSTDQELILTSPLLDLGFAWNEAILSWNTAAPDSAQFQFEVAPVFEGKMPRFYPLGAWCLATTTLQRKSLKQEFDPLVTMDTDTLILKKTVTELRVRIKIKDTQLPKADWVKFLAVSCSGPRIKDSSPPQPDPASVASRAAEARTPEPFDKSPKQGRIELHVPALSQLDYPDGKTTWCSPTSLTMALHYWSAELGRKDLLLKVPETAAAVFDPDWGGTGNWSFNTAFAGAFPGMRACVTRLENLAQMEACVRLGVPVVASVSYNRLKGLDKAGSGHLVVCIGFEANGDIILNDPGRSAEIKQSVPIARFQAAWAESKNTVYLVAPIDQHRSLVRGLRAGLMDD